MTNNPSLPEMTQTKKRARPGISELITRPVLRGFDEVAELFEIISGRGWIAGSFAAWMCSTVDTPILPNDIDIFASTPANALAIMRDVLDSKRGWVWDVNPVAYTLSPNPLLKYEFPHLVSAGKNVQVINPNPTWYAGVPESEIDVKLNAILNSFDLDICRAGLVTFDSVLADANAGGLTARIMNIQNPVKNVARIIKYAKRGVKFPDHELVKLFLAFQRMNGNDQERAIGRYTQHASDRDSGSWNFISELDERFFSQYPWDNQQT